MTTPPDSMRLDKWLWCARFYKTRSLAVDGDAALAYLFDGQAAKAARELRVGDNVALRQGPVARTVVIRALSNMRGPAPVAQQLYEETPESIAARAQAAEARRLAPEPATALREGRPTKRDRRDMDDLRHGWGERWSASLDD